MQQDAQELIKCAEEFEKIYSELMKAYKGQWQDDVHDSYGDYVKTVRISAEKMTEMAKKVENKCSEFNNLRVNTTIDEAKHICDEAINLCGSAEE